MKTATGLKNLAIVIMTNVKISPPYSSVTGRQAETVTEPLATPKRNPVGITFIVTAAC